MRPPVKVFLGVRTQTLGQHSLGCVGPNFLVRNKVEKLGIRFLLVKIMAETKTLVSMTARIILAGRLPVFFLSAPSRGHSGIDLTLGHFVQTFLFLASCRISADNHNGTPCLRSFLRSEIMGRSIVNWGGSAKTGRL